MAEQYVPNLGQLCGEGARRDAIHIAVAPAVAGDALGPGDWVSKLPDGTFGFSDADIVGVVDPFLDQVVKHGDKFWLLLFPGTITGLRHVWSHPAFAVKPPATVKETHERE